MLSFVLFNRQTRFVLPGSSGSPPKILTFDEVRDAIKNVEDMQFAHEIVIILLNFYLKSSTYKVMFKFIKIFSSQGN